MSTIEIRLGLAIIGAIVTALWLWNSWRADTSLIDLCGGNKDIADDIRDQQRQLDEPMIITKQDHP